MMFIQQLRSSRKTTIGVSLVAAAVGLAALVAVLMAGTGGTTIREANAVIDTGNTAAASGTPKVDYMLDLRTGVTTPLPDPIIVSVANFGRSSHTKYAASRDGTRLAYVGFGDDENPQIFVTGTDGRAIRQLTHDAREAMSPAWSPDGTRIAYVGYGAKWTGNARHLYVVDVDTGVSARVAGATGDVWSPQFTRAGTSILFTGGTASSPVVMIVPATGGRSRVSLEPDDGLNDTGNASLSPDGSLATFLASGWPKKEKHHCGPCRFVANADGTHRHVLAGECWGSSPAGTWSPDGRRIVCSDDINSIVVVDVATGKTARVAEGQSAIWLDRQTLLIAVA